MKLFAYPALLTGLLTLPVMAAEPIPFKEVVKDVPEQLTLKVQTVTVTEGKEKDKFRHDVKATAKVEKVKRSDSGLKVGDTIQLHYQTQKWGPNMVFSVKPKPFLLSKGKTYISYLHQPDREKKVYGPAVTNASSFQTPPGW